MAEPDVGGGQLSAADFLFGFDLAGGATEVTAPNSTVETGFGNDRQQWGQRRRHRRRR
jgi:hypothetical protein